MFYNKNRQWKCKSVEHQQIASTSWLLSSFHHWSINWFSHISKIPQPQNQMSKPWQQPLLLLHWHGNIQRSAKFGQRKKQPHGTGQKQPSQLLGRSSVQWKQERECLWRWHCMNPRTMVWNYLDTLISFTPHPKTLVQHLTRAG